MAYNDLEYKSKKVQDYIKGEILEDEEQLEDDPRFMASVANLTKQGNIYRLCSENVQGNYDFVDMYIKLFSDKPDMVIKACDNFLKLNMNDDENEIQITEILARAVNILGKRTLNEEQYEALYKYESELNRRYEFCRYIYDLEYNKPDDLGFKFITEEIYDNNPYIKRYVAGQTLSSIFNDKRMARQMYIINKSFAVDESNPFEKERPLTENEQLVLCTAKVLSFDEDFSQYIQCNEELFDQMVSMIKSELYKAEDNILSLYDFNNIYKKSNRKKGGKKAQ